MIKILVISDDATATGYGRISMEVNRRLHQRGYQIIALSLTYDGLLPATLDGQPLPYWVAGGQNKDFHQALLGVVGATQPDIIHVVQDAPYAGMVYNSPVDWTKHAFVITTPVDGVPIYRDWVDLLKQADATLSISEFGVEAHRQQGVQSELCRPGVDTNVFFQYDAARRAELRAKLGLTPDQFVLMTAAQNQGRKAIPAMIEGFFDFAEQFPDSRYLLDMDRSSPAGWDIEGMICAPNGWDTSKLIFRDQAIAAGLVSLTDRYNIADAHAVLAFREGYGIPLVEAMACGVVSIALDYCSGPEIVGDGKGVLIDTVRDADTISTWGGAIDKLPDVNDFTVELLWLKRDPNHRLALARKGMEWSRSHTWDQSADAVQAVYERVMDARRAANAANAQRLAQRAAAPKLPQPEPAPTPPQLHGRSELETYDDQTSPSIWTQLMGDQSSIRPYTPEEAVAIKKIEDDNLRRMEAEGAQRLLQDQQQWIGRRLMPGVDPLFPNAKPGNKAGTGLHEDDQS